MPYNARSSTATRDSNRGQRPLVASVVRAYRTWLIAGSALCILFPQLRAQDPILGWWPLWLVLLPLAGLTLPALLEIGIRRGMRHPPHAS